MDSPVVVAIIGTRTPCPNFFLPNAFPPRLPQLGFMFAEPVFLLARPIQLSVQGFRGDFACLSTFAQRFGLDLFSPLTQTRKDSVSRSMSAQVSLMLVRLATESQSANTFVRLVPDEPSFNKVPYAGCCLMLRNVEVH